jgi:hypothetical protein
MPGQCHSVIEWFNYQGTQAVLACRSDGELIIARWNNDFYGQGSPLSVSSRRSLSLRQAPP